MYSASIQLPKELSESEIFDLASAFEGLCSADSAKRIDNDDENPWLMQWYFEEKPSIDALRDYATFRNAAVSNRFDFESIIIEQVPDKNWLDEVYQQLQPFSVGPFFIYGSHYKGIVPEGQIGLLIDAARAFGSGDHGTTKGCLQAMLDLKGKGICPWNILDMGTGSGILAIAAWKLWQTPILAVDNDPEAVKVAMKYQSLNGVSDKKGAMECVVGDGFQSEDTLRKKPYDLIIANILAGPLIEMVAEAKVVCDTGGYILLSGTLVTQVDEVRNAYEAHGFILRKQIDIGKWSTLVMQNN